MCSEWIVGEIAWSKGDQLKDHTAHRPGGKLVNPELGWTR